MKLKHRITVAVSLIAVFAAWGSYFRNVEVYNFTESVQKEVCYYKGMEGRTFVYGNKENNFVHKAKIISVDCLSNTIVELENKTLMAMSSDRPILKFQLVDFDLAPIKPMYSSKDDEKALNDTLKSFE